MDPFDSLRRLFQHDLTVEDLAEPLVSYDFDQLDRLAEVLTSLA